MALRVLDGGGEEIFKTIEIMSLASFEIFEVDLFPEVFRGEILPDLFVLALGGDFVAESVELFNGLKASEALWALISSR